MSRFEGTVCDSCGSSVNDTEATGWAVLIVWWAGDRHTLDLCPQCADKVRGFIDDGCERIYRGGREEGGGAMKTYDFLIEGCGKDAFILTRAQVRWLTDVSYEHGERGWEKLDTFPCVHKATLGGGGRMTDEEAIERRVRDELYAKAVDEIAQRVHMARCYPVLRESLMQLAGGMTVFAASLFGVSSDEVTDAVSERVEAMDR